MNLNIRYGINFKANLISQANIKRFDKEKDNYTNMSASFVELNPSDKNDRNSVYDAVSDWKMDLYGMSIARSMDRLNGVKNPSDKIYAITTQKSGFSKLDPDKIEALTHVFETKRRIDVVHLQVNPDLVYSFGKPEYKYVGKGMIDSLKGKYNDRTITLISSSTASKFYEKQGFERVRDAENRMTWNKEAEEQSEYKDEYW